MQLLPALLNSWGVSSDWLLILFGVGVLQVLTTAPAGLIDQVPRDIRRLGRGIRRLVGGGRAQPADAAASSADAPASATAASGGERTAAVAAPESERSGEGL
jgi:hypothetical protein